MLGRVLGVLFVLSIVSQNALASNAIILPFKNQTYSWKEMNCQMQGGKNGADLTIENSTKEKSNQKGAIHITLRNFRSVMKNTPAGSKAIFELNDKTVGSVTLVENDGKVWGDVQLREMSTSCVLTVERGEDKHITLRGSCEQLGDSTKKTGPRTSLKIDEIEPLSCTIN